MCLIIASLLPLEAGYGWRLEAWLVGWMEGGLAAAAAAALLPVLPVRLVRTLRTRLVRRRATRNINEEIACKP